jgi:hypothetical protein
MKKTTQAKTSYNFLKNHSDDIEHQVKPIKATARGTDSQTFKPDPPAAESVRNNCLLTLNRTSYKHLQRRGTIMSKINSDQPPSKTLLLAQQYYIFFNLIYI